ncbi:hypothetical protein DL96DRAFT_774037 [Flagelloscypha sp. PMI_526]|nr:hypothetical protein DL96DRAFT_774037 [Flagelloscypha sp. PMI_526]
MPPKETQAGPYFHVAFLPFTSRTMNLPPIRTASPMTFERQYSPDIVHSLSPGSVGIQRRQSYQRGHSKPSPENSPNLGSPKGPSLRPFLRPTFDWRTDNELVPSYGNQTSYPSSVGSHAPSQRPRPQDDNPDMRQPALLAEATCFSPSGPSFSYPVIPSEHSYAPRSEWSGPPCEPTLPNANPTPDNVSFNLSHNRVRERSRNNTEDERYLLLSHDHWVANIRPDKVWCRGCEGDIELDDREHQRYYTSGFTSKLLN